MILIGSASYSIGRCVLLRGGRQIKHEAHLIAFDLIELDVRALASKPIEIRKAELACLGITSPRLNQIVKLDLVLSPKPPRRSRSRNS
jgi:hypothetical protein